LANIAVFLGGAVTCLVVGLPGHGSATALWAMWAAGVGLAAGLAAMYAALLPGRIKTP
jgi:hypothetical protein